MIIDASIIPASPLEVVQNCLQSKCFTLGSWGLKNKYLLLAFSLSELEHMLFRSLLSYLACLKRLLCGLHIEYFLLLLASPLKFCFHCRWPFILCPVALCSEILGAVLSAPRRCSEEIFVYSPY